MSSQRALEIELEMIRQALDGKIGEEKEEKDRFLREFCKLRARHEELLNQSIQARRSLKQVSVILLKSAVNIRLMSRIVYLVKILSWHIVKHWCSPENKTRAGRMHVCDLQNL